MICQYSCVMKAKGYPSTGDEITFICLTGHFSCWRKSHCSSPIATKDFGGPVSPQFDPGFIGSFHHFSRKEVPDLQKINPFTIIRYFSQKIPSSIAILFPISWNPKQNKVDILAKPAFQEVTQCHRTQTLYKI